MPTTGDFCWESINTLAVTSWNVLSSPAGNIGTMTSSTRSTVRLAAPISISLRQLDSTAARRECAALTTACLPCTWTKPGFPATTYDTSFFALYELQFKDWWLQPQIAYMINDKTKVALGFNIFAGSKQTPYGQYTNATNVYFTLSRVLL